MQVDFISLADAATVDAGGKLNVLGAHGAMAFRSFPATCRVVVAFRLAATRDDIGEHDLDVRLVDADGTSLSDAPPTRVGVGEGPGTIGRITLPGVLVMVPTFPGPGEYSVDMFANGRYLASSPIVVTAAAWA